jgi:hypothetical protein
MKINVVLALALFVLALAPSAGKADDDQQGRKACMYVSPCVRNSSRIASASRIVSCPTVSESRNRAAS